MALPDFPTLYPAERKYVAWRFNLQLPAGVTLSGTPTVTVTDVNGVDTNPNPGLVTGVAVGTYGSDAANTAVVAWLGSGYQKAGACYLFDIKCGQSDGGNIEDFNHCRCDAPA